MAKKLVDMFSEDEEEQFLAKLKEGKADVFEFCQRFNVEVIDIMKTREEMVLEPLYVFNDNLGGYTLKGIRDSL